MGESVRTSKATLLLKELGLHLCFQGLDVINLACCAVDVNFPFQALFFNF